MYKFDTAQLSDKAHSFCLHLNLVTADLNAHNFDEQESLLVKNQRLPNPVPISPVRWVGLGGAG